MSNNSAAKATLDVYQALFSTLDDYLSRTRFLEEVEMHDFTREVLMFSPSLVLETTKPAA